MCNVFDATNGFEKYAQKFFEKFGFKFISMVRKRSNWQERGRNLKKIGFFF